MSANTWQIVLEEGPSSWGATCPDLPGVVAAADSRDEVVTLMREAIGFHLEQMIKAGEKIPAPGHHVTSVTVAV